MLVDTKHKIGDVVFLKTDTDQKKRLVTGINIRSTGMVYLLSCGVDESYHYDFEITEEIDVLITSRN
jgi:hypothetical protein